MTEYSLTEDSKGKSLAIFYSDGDTVTIPQTHSKFETIIGELRTGTSDSVIRNLVDSMHDLGQKLSKLSERVAVTTYGVLFDGDRLRGELSDTILELHESGEDSKLKALVNFLEKAATNPSGQSIDDMYKWITNGDLVISPNGDFIAYKGVGADENGQSVSIHEGTAIVDGVVVTGKIPNPDGAVVEMARSDVDDNSYNGCSTGLHAGTYEYASGWTRIGRTLIVQINPRDVVSVPNDSSYAKLRVSRYTVISHVQERIATRFYGVEEDEDEEDFEPIDGCPFCEGGPCTGECYEEDYDEEDEDDEPEPYSQPLPKSHKPLRDAFGRFIGKK